MADGSPITHPRSEWTCTLGSYKKGSASSRAEAWTAAVKNQLVALMSNNKKDRRLGEKRKESTVVWCAWSQGDKWRSCPVDITRYAEPVQRKLKCVLLVDQ